MESEYQDEVVFMTAEAPNPVSVSASRVKAATEPDQSARVRVIAPFRVVHEGVAHTGGEMLSVPEATAAEWERARYVERVQAPPRKRSK